jgi:hypothetical protein
MPISRPLSPERWPPAPREPRRAAERKIRLLGERRWYPGSEGGRPLEFNKKYSVGTLRTQETRYITLPLHARFYQYAPTTSTGEVESHMIFNLTYD